MRGGGGMDILHQEEVLNKTFSIFEPLEGLPQYYSPTPVSPACPTIFLKDRIAESLAYGPGTQTLLACCSVGFICLV